MNVRVRKSVACQPGRSLRVPASFDDVDEPDEGGLGELRPPQQCEGMWETTLCHCGVQQAV